MIWFLIVYTINDNSVDNVSFFRFVNDKYTMQKTNNNFFFIFSSQLNQTTKPVLYQTSKHP